MPVAEASDQVTARSALRHRPLGDEASPFSATGITPVAQRASRLRPKDTEEDQTGKPTVPPRQAGRATGKTHRRAHPLFYLGIGMIAMLALWTSLTFVASWWNITWDDWHYSRPRTFQVDAYVGHSEAPGMPSHFIALNLRGRIEILEFPGGDASKTRIYIGPQLYGNGEDLVPVTLSFVDIKGNHQPDMVVHFQNTQIVYINEQGSFRPARPDELPAIQQYLQQHGQ